MWSAIFWRQVAERMIRAAAAAAIPLLTASGAGVVGVDWLDVLAISAGAALVSLLISLTAGTLLGPAGSPSMVEGPGDAALAQVSDASTGLVLAAEHVLPVLAPAAPERVALRSAARRARGALRVAGQERKRP